MPHHVFALILVLVIGAAGLTVWAATAAGGAFGVGLGALALPALLAWGLVRFIASRSGRR